MAGINVVFNGTSLQTNNVIVSQIKHDDLPRKKRNRYALARSNRSVTTNYQYLEKPIVIIGQIIGTSIIDLETRIEAFKLAINSLTGDIANLDIDYNGGTRRYSCGIESLNIGRSAALFKVGFEIEFVCDQPFGVDTTTTTLANAVAVSTSPKSQALTVGGTAEEQLLNISYTLTSFTGAAYETLYFKNNDTGQQMSITRTWTNGDVVVIDCVNMSVKVNGVETDYGGVFPPFMPGSRTLVITDNWSARSGSLTVSQIKRYN